MVQTSKSRAAARRAGKVTEARWATLLLGRRIPSPGRANRDIETPYPLCIEVKHRTESTPKWIRDALAQAVSDVGEGEIPVVIRHEKGDSWQEDVIFMSGESFMQIMRTVGTEVIWADAKNL